MATAPDITVSVPPSRRHRGWAAIVRQAASLPRGRIGLGVMGTLTQLNYVTNHHADLRLHLKVTGALAVWALASVALQGLTLAGSGPTLGPGQRTPTEETP